MTRPAAAGDRASQTRFGRRCVGTVVLVSIMALVVAAVSLGIFADKVARQASPMAGVAADGIVVLTGGPSRVADAVRLLERGSAERLLISGVYPATTSGSIAATIRANQALFDCCIDLDYRAQNTFGNASEARDWAARNAYRSLIVVTNDYHMPRSLVELGRALPPSVRLVPYPVPSERVRPDQWWRDPFTARVLSGEMVKYGLALVDIRFGIAVDERYQAAAAQP